MRRPGLTWVRQIAEASLIVGVLVGLSIANYRLALRAPGGNDFLARWVGANQWLVSGRNPYDPQVSLMTQIVIYGRPIWDPIVLLAQSSNPLVLVISMFALCLATLATNLAANVVSPANDFAHLWPKHISFRTGGLITGLVGILIQPWRLVADPTGYIFKWLVAYSGLLGSVGGVLIADYYLIRRTRLDLAGLYRREGPYWYTRGVNRGRRSP